jgi:aspartate kinase
LAAADINVEMISTSTIRISCVVRGDQVEDAVRVLHAAFDLAAEEALT